MKLFTHILIFLLLIAGQICLAQDALSAFFVNGDTTYQSPNATGNAQVIATGGVKPEEGYIYKWWSEPEGVVPYGENRDSEKFTSSGTEDFDIFCVVYDANGDSVQLQQHVVRSYTKNVALFQDDPVTHVFTGQDLAIDLLSLHSPSISGYSMEYQATGNEGAILTKTSPTSYVFHSDRPGVSTVHFILKYEGVEVARYSRLITVGDPEVGALMTFPSFYSLGNDDPATKKYLEPEVWFLEDNLSGTVTWSSTDPNIQTITTEEFEVVNHKMQTSFRFHPGSESSSIYTLQAEIMLDNGQEITLSEGYYFENQARIKAMPTQGCEGEIVQIPIIFKDLQYLHHVEVFDLEVKYDASNLKLTGLHNNSFDSSPFLDIHEITDSSLRVNHGFYSPNYNDDVYGFKYYERDGTIITLDFLVLKEGAHEVEVIPHHENLSAPGIVDNGVVEGRAHEGKNTTIDVIGVSGLPMVKQVAPSPYIDSFHYEWETEAGTHEEPVLSVGAGENTCLNIEDTQGCEISTCVEVDQPEDNLFSISGKLLNQEQHALQGEVYAYLLQDGEYYPAGKSGTNSEGYFTVENLIEGDYVLLGLPQQEDYNAAYYYGEGIRDKAVSISVTGNVTDVDLVLSEKAGTTGEVFSGTFEKDSLTEYHENIFEEFYGELPSVVFMTDDNGGVIDWSVMDENNNYSLMNYTDESALHAYYGRVPDELMYDFSLTPLFSTKSEVEAEVYPNPFHREVVVETNEDVHLKCINAEGVSVLERDLPGGKSTVEVSSLSAGHYTIVIRGDRLMKAFKLIKH